MNSLEWKQYYEHNAKSLMPVPWELGGELAPAEKESIASSVQTFQAGESSEGNHLFKYAKAYVERSGDAPYLPACRLFIAEEQRHARDLGRFLDLNGIPRVKTTFTDTVFRKLRNLFGGLEISIAVLVTAEIIAMAYYAALREATQSKILRTLCDQILRDELMHVRFQTEQLHLLRSNRFRLYLGTTMAAQRFLFLGTVIVVGIFHRKALAAGGYGFRRWWRHCWREFNSAFATEALRPVGI